MTSTQDSESERSARWFDRMRVNSPLRAGVSGAVVLAVLLTASISLAATSNDKPAAAKQKPAAQTDDSYLTPVGTLLQNNALPRPSLAGDTGTAGVPAGTKPRPSTPPTTAPTDSGQITTYSGGSGTLTPAGIATLAIKAGCSAGDAVTATAVAIAESGGSPAAQGDVTLMDATWDWSAGLWQIRGLRDQRGSGQLRDSIANQNPVSNAAAMYTISSGCSSWTPWTTYTRGTYLSFLTIARQAVGYVGKYQSSHGGKLPTVAPRNPGAPIPVGDGSGGNANAAPAATNSSSAPAAHKTTSRGATTAKPAPGKATTTAAAGGSNGGSTKGGTAATATPTPTPSKTSKLPIHLPTKLPTLLPTTIKVPTKLPIPLPSLSLPIHLP